MLPRLTDTFSVVYPPFTSSRGCVTSIKAASARRTLILSSSFLVVADGEVVVRAVGSVLTRMLKLIDTERSVQQPLDRAASSILTDRSLFFERASWQQCSDCNEWIEDNDIEYTFECVLGLSPSGTPTVNFEMKTRYPAYTCTQCVDAPPQAETTPGCHNPNQPAVAGEAEQLCPLHVQAVYMVQGSATNNIGGITKGFLAHCPDCGRMSNLLQTPHQINAHIQQHLHNNSSCKQYLEAFLAGAYDNPAAFGGFDFQRPVVPEKVVKELMGRLIVMAACHIVCNTRPPPTPVDKLTGMARVAAAATAELRSEGFDGNSSEDQQLLPYRLWAVNALSLDSELLTEANWVRPSLAGLALEHKPSLLDLVLAPPYIAVAEHDAGMTVDKLAVLLLREQQRQQYGVLAGLAAAAAAGERLPAAVAATETALAQILAQDSVIQHIPVGQQVQQFLAMASISSLGDVVYALAQPHVHGRTSRHLNVCAVCGMTPGALKRAKRTYALHRCKYCIVSTCQSCRQVQQAQQPMPATPTEAAAAEKLCLWCQGHPDTLGGEMLFGRKGKGRRFLQSTATADMAGDFPAASAGGGRQIDGSWCYDDPAANGGAAVAAAGCNGRRADQHLLKQHPGAAVSKQHCSDHDEGLYSQDDKDSLQRLSQHCELAVELAAAAAAAGRLGKGSSQQARDTAATAAPHDHGHSLQPESDTDLQLELHQLQQLQAELQQLLGAHVLPPVDEQQRDQPQTHYSKRRLSMDTAAAGDASHKRQCTQQERPASQTCSPSAPTAAAWNDQTTPRKQQYHKHNASSTDAGGGGRGVTGVSSVEKRSRPPHVRSRPPRVPRCGQCSPCMNIHLKKGCSVNRRRLQEGKPFIIGPEGAAVDMLDVDPAPREGDCSEPDVSDFEPASPGTVQAADILAGLLSARVFELPGDTDSAEPAADCKVPVSPEQAAAAAADVSHPFLPRLLPHAADESEQQDSADARVAITAGPAPRKLQQQTSVSAALLACDEAAVLEQRLDQGLALLQKDIGLCTARGSVSEANATMQDIQGLKIKLADAYQQTGDLLFKTGLQILIEIMDSFHALKLPVSKVALACNMQLLVPAAYGPHQQACTIFEVLMCSWYKELRDTGLMVSQVNAAPAAPGTDLTVAGLSQDSLDMLTQLSFIPSRHMLAQQALDGTSMDAGLAAVQQAIEQASVSLTSSLGLLLLHWPEQLCDASGRRTGVMPWRECLQKWKCAADYQNVVTAARDMQHAFDALRIHAANGSRPAL